MSQQVIVKGTVVTPFTTIPEGAVAFRGARLTYVGAGKDAPSEGRICDFGDNVVSPGLIDLHVHGCRGSDFTENPRDSLKTISDELVSAGVTSFVPTTYSAPYDVLAKVAESFRDSPKHSLSSHVLGIHLEGPCLNPSRRGAHSSANLRCLNSREFLELHAMSGNQVKLVTLAPELPGVADVCKLLSGRGIVVSAGHSDASFEEMMRGISAGVTHVTHLFNGMRPFHHRDPGILGAALTDARVTCELIADGIHVHPAAIRLAIRAKSSGGIALVSDCVKPAGLIDGSYFVGGTRVTLRGDRCLTESGDLAGSVSTVLDGVRNVVRLAGAGVQEAVEMASATPSRVLGLSDRKGCLAPGMDADLAVFDRDFNALMTVVGGRVVHEVDIRWQDL